jgi:hypothetical protein
MNRFTRFLFIVVIAISSYCHGQEALDPSEITYAIVDSNTSNALSATWKRVQLHLYHKSVQSSNRSIHGVSKPVAARFLGFLEGRLQTQIPYEFEKLIQKCEMYGNGNIRFPVSSIDIIKEPEFPFLSPNPKKVTVEEESNGGLIAVRVVSGPHPCSGLQGKFSLPESFSKKLSTKASNEELSVSDVISDALFSKHYFFVVTTDATDPGGQVHCFSLEDNKHQWSREMMKYCGEGEYSGSASWFTKLTIGQEKIYLFHCSEMAVGLEGFSFEGEQIFSFSTHQPRRNDERER